MTSKVWKIRTKLLLHQINTDIYIYISLANHFINNIQQSNILQPLKCAFDNFMHQDQQNEQHGTWYMVHGTRYMVHGTQYMEHCTRYTVHARVYTVHGTQYMERCTRYTIHGILYTLQSTQYTVHGTLYTVHG